MKIWTKKHIGTPVVFHGWDGKDYGGNIHLVTGRIGEGWIVVKYLATIKDYSGSPAMRVARYVTVELHASLDRSKPEEMKRIEERK